MSQALTDLGNQLVAKAANSGAGSYLVDEVVQRTVRGVPAVTDVCTNLAFVDTAITNSCKSVFADPKNLAQVRDALRNAIRAVGCGSSSATASKADFQGRLNIVVPRNVVGHPLSADAAQKRVTFKFKIGTYEERQATVPVPVVDETRSALLRMHSDGTVTFLRQGADKRATLAVKSLSPMSTKGWFNVEFGTKDKSFGAIPVKGSSQVGNTATVFTSGDAVTQFIAWGTKPTSAPTASPTSQPTSSPNNINIVVKTNNESKSDADGGGPAVYDPYYGGAVVVTDPVATVAPDPTETPEPAPPPPAPLPQPAACPPQVVCPTTTGMQKPGTFFCMSKRTMIIVCVMFVLASALLGLGWWVYRKKARAGATGPNGAPPSNGLGDMGGFGGGDIFGAPPPRA